MRIGKSSRDTRETSVVAEVNLDGSGSASIDTPIGFLNHMLESLARHSLIDIEVQASGDIEVDQHHTVEDCGFVLGSAIEEALGNRVGINRAGFFVYPMDEALSLCAVDLSGRPYVQFEGKFQYQFCGGFETSLTKHFLEAMARGMGANIAIRLLAGENDHHKIEAIFKSLAKSLKQACEIEPRLAGKVPSTKEVID